MPGMVMVAGAWYSNATVWAALAVAATLIVGIATVLATLRGPIAKIRLSYGVRSIDNLLEGHLGLTVHHAGVLLSTPHVVVFDLANHGRRDIESGMFPDGTPITFDFSQPVLAVLGSTGVRGTAPVPVMTVENGKAVLAAAHLSKRQVVSYTLLLGGPTESELSVTGSLLNGDVRRASVAPGGDYWAMKNWGILQTVAAGIGVILLMCLGVFTHVAVVLPDSLIDWLQGLFPDGS